MPGKIFVSGLGAVSAIGLNVKENLSALRNLESGIAPIRYLATKHKNEYQAGEVKYTNEKLASLLSINTPTQHPRTALLAMKAAEEAFKHAQLNAIDGANIGFIGGTTVGGMDKTEKNYLNHKVNNSFILSHSCGYISELVAQHLNISGYISTLNTACSSSTNAILTGARLIKHGIVDIVMAGGFDSLSKFTINGFKTLHILSPDKCTPFDENRKGLSLGEGAGFIVLESEESLLRRGKTPICELSGYANANDAFHQTASSANGEGPYISMTKAIKMSQLKPSDIDYINVHGTGTENNDLSEGIALKRVFKDTPPPFSSTKSYIGHTLGAAGGIEAVYSALALQENLIFPNLFFKTAIKELNITPETNLISNKTINNVMTNSFGFGGNDSTLIFSKI
jgi:3-oxoacyl-[acyl-carrier-protein] synthase-1